MLSFLLRRAFSSILVMFCVVSLAFVLIRSIKGGPFEREKTPAHIVAAMEAKYQLDGSLWQQYLAYLNRLAHLDLGPSAKYRDWQVSEILAQKLPNSISIGSIAFMLASTIGVLLGGSWGTAQQMILPAICLSAPYIAYIARLMRNSLLDVLKSDFLRTARAKGLSETAAVARHAAKIALLPVITYLGPLAAHLLTGSMIIENVFNISGAGSVFVNSIQNRDVFLLGGAVIVLCAMLVLFNLIVDLLYTVLDKRIRINA